MSKTVALGLAGVAISAAMLGFGFYSGQRTAVAAAPPSEIATHVRAAIIGVIGPLARMLNPSNTQKRTHDQRCPFLPSKSELCCFEL